jgi:endogenous inhibitor of DNA gyrase (YacG/DUF329 family)
MSEDTYTVTCPSCRKKVVFHSLDDAPYLPFCCERCKLIDLGKWFDGEQRISDATSSEDQQTHTG